MKPLSRLVGSALTWLGSVLFVLSPLTLWVGLSYGLCRLGLYFWPQLEPVWRLLMICLFAVGAFYAGILAVIGTFAAIALLAEYERRERRARW